MSEAKFPKRFGQSPPETVSNLTVSNLVYHKFEKLQPVMIGSD
jgi:hypothetical protein